jgi:hypothetical protein
MNLRDLKRSLRGLTPEQLRRLDEYLQEMIERTAVNSRPQLTKKLDALEERRNGHKTYRLERVRCGKEKCRCASGELHGPYWYAYWSEGGRTRSQYVGKKLPAKKNR